MIIILSADEAQKRLAEARNGTLLELAGPIFELSVTVVKANGETVSVHSFQTPVEVALPVPQEGQEAAKDGKLQAYRYDPEQQRWNWAGGTYDESRNAIVIRRTHFSQYALMIAKESFMQTFRFKDIEGHWAQQDIEFMFANGYVHGMKEGVFAPDEKVTRAQFVTMLANVFSLSDGTTRQPGFADVPAGHWAASAIEAVAERGWVSGYEDGTFRPDRTITRQEIAAKMHRILQEQGFSDSPQHTEALRAFRDAGSVAEWAEKDIAAVVSHGLMSGRGEGIFAPNEAMTRAESVSLLKRMIEKLGK